MPKWWKFGQAKKDRDRQYERIENQLLQILVELQETKKLVQRALKSPD